MTKINQVVKVRSLCLFGRRVGHFDGGMGGQIACWRIVGTEDINPEVAAYDLFLLPKFQLISVSICDFEVEGQFNIGQEIGVTRLVRVEKLRVHEKLELFVCRQFSIDLELVCNAEAAVHQPLL